MDQAITRATLAMPAPTPPVSAAPRLVGEFQGFVDGIEPSIRWLDRKNMPQVGDRLFAIPAHAAAARAWSILLTSANHGTVGPLGSTFPHAGEHHERVIVVEVPASAGAPSDQVNLVLRASRQVANKAEVEPVAEEVRNAVHAIIGPGFHIRLASLDIASIISKLATPPATTGASTASIREILESIVQDGYLSETKAHRARRALDESVGASTVLTDERIDELWAQAYNDALAAAGLVLGNADVAYMTRPLLFARAIERVVAAQAGQVAVPAAELMVELRRWSGDDPGYAAHLIRAAIAEIERLAAAPSAPAVAQQAPMAVDGVRWDLFPGYLIDHCEGDVLSEEGLQSALAGMLKDPQYLAAVGSQASTAGERQPEGGAA